MVVRAVAFDLGNTLKNYETFPLNWQGFYRNAIVAILRNISINVTPERIQTGDTILLKYNTRVNPRDYEVSSQTIFIELFHAWGVSDINKVETAERVFASYFTRNAKLYPETVPVLRELKKKDFKVGILTNVAYGMPGEYLLKDTEEINQYIDVFLTSIEVGFRKPHPKGYQELVQKLGVSFSECLFVGDEDVDIIGANRVGMASVLIDRQKSNVDFGQKYSIASLNELLALLCQISYC